MVCNQLFELLIQLALVLHVASVFGTLFGACCSCVSVRPSISVKADWFLKCCASFLPSCATCSGSKPSASWVNGSSRVLRFPIPRILLDVVSCCRPSLVVNLMALVLILLFGWSPVAGRPGVVVLLRYAVACLHYLLLRRLFLLLVMWEAVLAALASSDMSAMSPFVMLVLLSSSAFSYGHPALRSASCHLLLRLLHPGRCFACWLHSHSCYKRGVGIHSPVCTQSKCFWL